jgi:SAM-dependent methyltransferase
MFGTNESYEIASCGTCESLNLVDTLSIEQIADLYPSQYYSFLSNRLSPLMAALQSARDVYLMFGGPAPLGWLIAQAKPVADLAVWRALHLKQEERILDVGAGEGRLIERLKRIGFDRVEGIDPYLPTDRLTQSGVRVRSLRLDAVEGAFDVVMFNHALEHIPDPLAALETARRLLTPAGRIIVRVPTPDSATFETYGPHWHQIDAPRHFFLPSRRGMATLAARAGLRVVSVIDDSEYTQFAYAEAIRMGLTVSQARMQLAQLFDRHRRAAWQRETVRLNAVGRGDQAAFSLVAA